MSSNVGINLNGNVNVLHCLKGTLSLSEHFVSFPDFANEVLSATNKHRSRNGKRALRLDATVIMFFLYVIHYKIFKYTLEVEMINHSLLLS